jgi:hypothetical protein
MAPAQGHAMHQPGAADFALVTRMKFRSSLKSMMAAPSYATTA